jgi:hypothetical protein
LAGSTEAEGCLAVGVAAGVSSLVDTEAAAFFLASLRFAFLLAAAEVGSGVAEAVSAPGTPAFPRFLYASAVRFL